MPKVGASEDLRASGLAYAGAIKRPGPDTHAKLSGDRAKASYLIFQREEFLEAFARHLGICQKVFARLGNPADLAAAFATAERGTARVFLENMARARTDVLGGIPRETHVEEARLQAKLRRLEERISAEEQQPLAYQTARPHPKKCIGTSAQLAEELQDFFAKMGNGPSQVCGLEIPSTVYSHAEARSCLSANEIALLFVLGNKQSYVLLIEPLPNAADPAGGLSLVVLPAADQIAEQTAPFIDSERLLALPARVRSLGSDAFALLLGPLWDRIRGKDLVMSFPAARCAIYPSELLMEPAEDRNPKHFLIEKHRIPLCAHR